VLAGKMRSRQQGARYTEEMHNLMVDIQERLSNAPILPTVRVLRANVTAELTNVASFSHPCMWFAMHVTVEARCDIHICEICMITISRAPIARSNW
jgi:hypothetical protein